MTIVRATGKKSYDRVSGHEVTYCPIGIFRCYDKWQEMRRCYNMKWSKVDSSIPSFERFFNDELSFDVMLQRIKEMVQILPYTYGQNHQVCMSYRS
jgi:hypothetical protein